MARRSTHQGVSDSFSSDSDLFDLTPDDEQQMLSESVRDFALAKLRPAAVADPTPVTAAAGRSWAGSSAAITAAAVTTKAAAIRASLRRRAEPDVWPRWAAP